MVSPPHLPMHTLFRLFLLTCVLSVPANAQAEIDTHRLADIFMRDACVLVDQTTRTYYLVASTRGGVRAYTSKDLLTWEGPHQIFRYGPDTWEGANVTGTWAPELHQYREKYYLFLTYNTSTAFPEQWRNWRPRVKRATTILVSDSPLGPFKPFGPKPTLPEDMMTLHSPNSGPNQRIHLFEMDDTGDTLRIVHRFPDR